MLGFYQKETKKKLVTFQVDGFFYRFSGLMIRDFVTMRRMCYRVDGYLLAEIRNPEDGGGAPASGGLRTVMKLVIVLAW